MTLLERAEQARRDREAAIALENLRRNEERDGNLRRWLISFADDLIEDKDAPIGVDPVPEEERRATPGAVPRFATYVDETRVGIALDRRILIEVEHDGETRWSAPEIRGKTGDDLLVEIARAHVRTVQSIEEAHRRRERTARREEESDADERFLPRIPPDLIEEAEATMANPSVTDQTHALTCAVLALVGQVDRIAFAIEERP